MTRDNFIDYCLNKDSATKEFPFDEVTAVFKVMNKMFALLHLGKKSKEEESVNLKCDPSLARDLRSSYKGVIPGYHMNKEHWNTVYLSSDVPDERIYWLIDHSYDLVLSKLSRRDKEKLSNQTE